MKHRRHYFFLREERDDGELYSPLALLRELARWSEEFGLVKTIPAGRPLYRARSQKPGETLSSAADLGPPPEDKATMSNRMNPPGIVMFYVSDSPETALREIAKDPAKDVGDYAIGELRTRREMKILDLAEVPPIPSIFAPVSDTLEYDPRPPTIFLNYFATELSQPIARDRSIHVEYIPTQVITEYFRTEFLHNGQKIDGIRYSSARHSDHSSLVLFATQDDLVGGNPSASGSYVGTPDRWIELTRYEQRHVTAEALEQWEREAPKGVEWVR
ncbi:MAG: RES family NAD+ phosphorylase [Rhodospirillales bacterium]|nr:RES family NAD+ phosphorylase [Rhodospirillales bacterium]